MYKIQDLCL